MYNFLHLQALNTTAETHQTYSKNKTSPENEELHCKDICEKVRSIQLPVTNT